MKRDSKCKQTTYTELVDTLSNKRVTWAAQQCLDALRKRVTLYPCDNIDELRWTAQQHRLNGSKPVEGRFVYNMFVEYVTDQDACILKYKRNLVADMLCCISWWLETRNEMDAKRCAVCRSVDDMESGVA
jgi:hypothetical protein